MGFLSPGGEPEILCWRSRRRPERLNSRPACRLAGFVSHVGIDLAALVAPAVTRQASTEPTISGPTEQGCQTLMVWPVV